MFMLKRLFRPRPVASSRRKAIAVARPRFALDFYRPVPAFDAARARFEEECG